MALLDMARKNLKYIEVGHVNYHKRETALRDEKIVRRYCKKYNIKFHILNFKPEKVKGNFQACARQARYEFFNKLCDKAKLDGVLVAHHKDDLIETYLMQLDKKLGVDHYGLAEFSILYDVFVYRPLLNYTKNDLLKYCEDNNLEYGIDESNLSDEYERNRVRHSKVEKMSVAQKNNIVRQINKKNEKVRKELHTAFSYLAEKEVFSTKEFLKIPYIKRGLREFFDGKSDKFYDEMLRQIKESNTYLYKSELFWIAKEYDEVRIFIRPLYYSYRFDNVEQLKGNYDYFKIRKTGTDFDGVTLRKSDFPITIRSAQKGDKIKLRYGTKKLNRFFIDNKILIKDREIWPVVLNKKGIAILVPGIGSDINHYSKKHTVHVIKL